MVAEEKITIYSTYLQSNLNNVVKAVVNLSYICCEGKTCNKYHFPEHQKQNDYCNINSETQASYMKRLLSIFLPHAYMALQKELKLFKYLGI